MKNLSTYFLLLGASVLPLSLCRAQTTVFRDFTPSDTSGNNIIGSNPIVGGTWSGDAGGAALKYGSNGGNTEATPYSMYTDGAGRSIFGQFASALGAGQKLTVTFNLLGFGGNWPNTGGYAGVSLYVGNNEDEFIGEPNNNNSIGLDALATGHQSSGNTTVGVLASFSYVYDTGAWTFITTGGVSMSGTGTANLAFDKLQIHNGNGADIDLNNLSVVISPATKNQTVFLDSFSEASGTVLVGQPANIGGTWSQNGTSANGLTVGPANSLNTRGAGRQVFNGFTSALGAGQMLTLTYDTVDDGNTAALNGGWAGVSLYSGYVSGNTVGNEQIFVGNPSASAWGTDGGVTGRNFGGDNTLVNHLTLTYVYDTGAWTFSSNNFSTAGTGVPNIALNGLRVGNGNNADIDLDNITVNISAVPVVIRGSQPSVGTIYSFPSAPNVTGDGPTALIQGTDGNFYGTTQYDGSLGSGTVYKITPGGTETTLYSFGGAPFDGLTPVAGLLQGANGGDGSLVFYGTTEFGGTAGSGTVFAISISPSGNITESVLHSFGVTAGDGVNPASALIVGADGNLYGTTLQGGANNKGAVFQISSGGTESVFYSFGANPNDGVTPYSSLLLASDGNFYGTTQFGGSNANGTVYQLSAAGVETAVYSFGGATHDGVNPRSGLVAVTNGGNVTFYGTTQYGGAASQGTVFSVTSPGPGELAESVIYSFGAAAPDGSYPAAGLVLAADGNLYGTTQNGGSYGGGTVFGITTTGTETLPFSFGANTNDAAYSVASLTIGNDGNLYGASTAGGLNSDGAIFKVWLTPPTALPPVANDFVVVLTGGAAQPINVVMRGGDSDPNSPALPLTVTSVSPATLGSVKITGDNTVLYTPYKNFLKFSGTDTFTYTIGNGSATATASVTIANPFYLQKGNFAGLVAAPDGSQAYLTLTLAGGGAFTGKLRSDLGLFTLKGQFDANGQYTATVGHQTFTLSVNINDIGGNSGSGDGSFTIAGAWAGNDLSVGHALYNAVSNPAPQAGTYTVLLPAAAPASASVPYGTGYATLTVAETGAVTLAGSLGDGTKISDGVVITGGNSGLGNQFGVMIVLPYKALSSSSQPGALSGVMTFEEVSGVSDCDGVLEWSKPQTKPGLYSDGFDTTVSAIGSQYTAPPVGTLAMVLPATSPNAAVGLAEPDFTSTLAGVVNVTVGKGNNDTVTLVSGTATGLTMTITAKSGVFGGTFLNPKSGKTAKVQGVVYPKQNIAGGYFLSPAQSGAVTMIPYAAPVAATIVNQPTR